MAGETFPEEAAQLHTELEKLNQACIYIESLKGSAERDYRLMYEDIRCWNAKLKTLSTIALDALDMLEQGNTMSRAEGWEKYMRLKNTLHRYALRLDLPGKCPRRLWNLHL